MRGRNFTRASLRRWPRGRWARAGMLLLALLMLAAGCSGWMWGRSARSSSDLEVRPASGDTARLLHNAHYLSLLGRPELALKELEEAYQREPHNLKVVNALARACEAVGDYGRAQQVYGEALARVGGNPALENNRCYSYYRAGDFKWAEDCFRQALARDPGNVAARNNLGLLLCRTGRPEEARRLWQEAEGAVAAEKKLQQVLAFLGTAGSALYARQAAPPAAPAAPPAPGASSPAVKPGPVAAPPEARAAGTPAAATPPKAKAQAGKPPAARERAQATRAPATKTAAVKPATPAPTAASPAGPPAQKTAAPGPARPRFLTFQELTGTRIRVENGNGFPHLARDTRVFLWGEGFPVVAIKNYLDFGVAETVIYCRPAAARVAQVLGEKFFQTARVQISEKLPRGLDIRVILGHDLLLKEDLLAKLAG